VIQGRKIEQIFTWSGAALLGAVFGPIYLALFASPLCPTASVFFAPSFDHGAITSIGRMWVCFFAFGNALSFAIAVSLRSDKESRADFWSRGLLFLVMFAALAAALGNVWVTRSSLADQRTPAPAAQVIETFIVGLFYCGSGALSVLLSCIYVEIPLALVQFGIWRAISRSVSVYVAQRAAGDKLALTA
jgi:hypothetical protein